MADPTFDDAQISKLIQKARQGKEINFAFGLGSKSEQSAFFGDATKAGNILSQRLRAAHPKLTKVCFGTFTLDGTDITLFPNRALTGMLVHLERKFRKAGLSKYTLALGQAPVENAPQEAPPPGDGSEENQRATYQGNLAEHVEDLKSIPKRYWDADLPDRLKRASQAASPEAPFNSAAANEAISKLWYGIISSRQRHEFAKELKELVTVLTKVDRAFWPGMLVDELALAKANAENTEGPFDADLSEFRKSVEIANRNENVFPGINEQKFLAALCACTFGSAPGALASLQAISPPTVEQFRAQRAAVAQAGGGFGMCSSPTNPAVATANAGFTGVLTPVPCMPALTGDWEHEGRSARCQCAFGGEITVSSDLTLPDKREAWRMS